MKSLLLALTLLGCAIPGVAACPALACGPDALGTSRILAVGTRGGGAVGLKTYPRTLKLAPGEVVLTFDDGPMPGRTEKVLAALDAQCVKATFFMIGRNAAATPALAAQVERAGHTIGYHSMTHPIMSFLPPDKARADIDEGFAAVDKAVYGVAAPQPHSPFFRFPGFADTTDLDNWLASRNIVIFGADLWASDWTRQTPEAELKLIMSRLEKSKGGIVLLHDIQPRTVAMLPQFLQALKRNNFKIVHLVPGAGPLETNPAPDGWSSQTQKTLDAQKAWAARKKMEKKGAS